MSCHFACDQVAIFVAQTCLFIDDGVDLMLEKALEA
jgi:hypothetical protein